MTKVIQKRRKFRPVAAFLLMAWLFSHGQESPSLNPSARARNDAPPLHVRSAEDLFLQLGSVGLDPSRVYRARDVSLDRAAFHITLDDGVIGFTSDVAGRVTGAFFEGEGEILLTPPNQVERASMMLQTRAAILEERFSGAYFRFNDDTFTQLKPILTATDGTQDFVSRWDQVARNLAAADVLRVFMTFAQFLPAGVEQPPSGGESPGNDDRFLHARLQGETKGTFDVYFDSDTPEQVWAAQARTLDDVNYYDVWTSFAFLPKEKGSEPATNVATEEGRASSIEIPDCKVRAEINPPTTIQAEAVLDLQVHQGGQRAVLFELARTLVIKQVEADGKPVEFIHNPSMEGTQLARHGNDLVAVVFAKPTRAGQKIKLRFVYGGEVLSEAGPGLLYVGARGTWYPNRGLGMSNFDLEFHYPAGWNLVATGKRVENSLSEAPLSGSGAENAGEQVSRWISERPIPFAGFNLGKYHRAVVHAGDVTVEAYGTGGVERGFPQAEAMITEPVPGIGGATPPPVVIPPTEPSPARNTQMVAAAAARAVEFFSRRFGPYPFTELALTQMPGNVSQGWPGLIFLSSFSFLNEEEKSALHMAPLEKTLIGSIVAHETAHQWWGDLVSWSDYRDQWISEGLANYSALMLLEAADPREFHAVMGKYREDLLEKNKSRVALMEDGPVTLGQRLSCSQFPHGYMAISYGRGTWLFHMLRTMMRDAEPNRSKRGQGNDPENEPFMRALRRMRDRYEGKSMTTREMLQVFQEDLPLSLRYEGRKSLDWFYDGWINGTAIPRFELRSVKYTDKEVGTTVTGMIFQKDAPKDLVTPVPLYASRDGKLVFLGRVFADGVETPFHLSAPAGTRKILVDPDQTLLARVR